VTWLAVVFALAGAATAAVSTSVQHHAASSAPPRAGAADLLRHLIRRPAWLGALLLAPLGFTLHVLALHNGPIGLVQPILITGLVFAVPIRAALSRSWPRRSELVAVSVTAGGIAVLLLASDARPAVAAPDSTTLLMAVGATAGVVLLMVGTASGVRRPVGAAFLLGTAAGLLFALMAVLIKAVQLHEAEHGLLAAAFTWLPYALVACGVGGVAVNQLAYRSARLSASMPVLNVANCLVAVGFGHAVFGESLTSGPGATAAAAAALFAMTWGLWSLARYDDRPAGIAEREPVAAEGPQPFVAT
jgi:drug/metabolite transporter (DMT)-like permease